jgi:hypothetical protein
VPLIAEGTVIGVLALGAREREFEDEQIRLAARLPAGTSRSTS